MAGISPEQYARLMSGIKTATKAKVAGVQTKSSEVKRVMNFVDSNNSTQAKIAERAEVPRVAALERSRGEVSFSGAPHTLEGSGLAAQGFIFDASQKQAIQKLINGQHVCLIGPAGTGKTTMVKHAMAHLIYGGPGVSNPIGIRQLGGEQGPSIAICAFTGIATQVISDTLPPWLQVACKTIHSLLEYKPTDGEGAMFVPSRTAVNKLDHDIIVIDEASMLGLDLWHNLVDALRPSTRVILIGDLNQLRPVADATFFAYALSAGIDNKDGWSLAELTTIHRQKEPAANKIIDASQAILNGRTPIFDDQKDPNWRFIGFELPPQAGRAHEQIAGAINWLRKQPTPDNPERALFDPYKDLLLTAGNGYDENDSASFVQQYPLNGTLSQMIEPQTDEHPLYIIDAGRESKRFAVGHRVMATKNEAPTVKDRVTNGLTGRITEIMPNTNWKGNKSLFGTEKEVLAWRSQQAKLMQEQMRNGLSSMTVSSDGSESVFTLGAIDTSRFTATEKQEDRQASHRVTVQFNNGAKRTYSSAAEVGGIQLAYAITVHKAQGSQADTVIIICHQAVKKQLNREWFYTGVTRARRRVIVLYTKMGLSVAVNRQQIFGSTLKEKVDRYRSVMTSGRAFVRLKASATSIQQERAAIAQEAMDADEEQEHNDDDE